MSEQDNGLHFVPLQGHEEAMAVLSRLADAAQPSAVFGEPITTEGQTVITACEISVGLGFGYGLGGSSEAAPTEDEEPEAEAREGPPSGFGGGGGGGGGTSARPVAVIHINSDGVRVEPVVDVTKLALAFFTMLGSIFMMASRMRKGARTR
jgi:uncharacterized spore protein YtfJ